MQANTTLARMTTHPSASTESDWLRLAAAQPERLYTMRHKSDSATQMFVCWNTAITICQHPTKLN